MPKNVVVVGMPRSGTSLTASIFARQGYFLAPDEESELRDGDGDNPDGYFEADSLVEANARVLSRAGFDRHNTWLYEPIDDARTAAIRDLEPLPEDRELLSQYEANTPWLWKDPRLCYTLAYWWPLFNHDTTRVLLACRDAGQIWNSFLRLGWRQDTETERADVFERVERHIGAARATIDAFDIPHIEVDYAEYASQPRCGRRAHQRLHVDVGGRGRSRLSQPLQSQQRLRHTRTHAPQSESPWYRPACAASSSACCPVDSPDARCRPSPPLRISRLPAGAGRRHGVERPLRDRCRATPGAGARRHAAGDGCPAARHRS